jgi:outer membrane immunogenic protein
MQKLAIAAALTMVSLATFHGANAADMGARPLAYTPPPPPPPAFSWTGFYIGGNGGGASDHDSFNGTQSGVTTLPAFPGLAFPFTTSFGGSNDGGGAVLGGQIGFNYEFPFSHVVIGVEGDGDWANIVSSGNSCNTITSGVAPFVVGATGGCATVNRTLDSFETIRGRLGYAFTTNSTAFPSVLLYATGGGAWGHVNGNFQANCLGATCPTTSGAVIAPGTGGAQFSGNTDTGWVAGAGFEWVIYDHWTWRFEYLHLQFPNVSTNFGVNTAAVATGGLAQNIAFSTHTSNNVGVDVVRIGVNYLFHWGGPNYAF